MSFSMTGSIFQSKLRFDTHEKNNLDHYFTRVFRTIEVNKFDKFLSRKIPRFKGALTFET